MSVGNVGVPESGSALSRSASVGGGSKNANGKVRSASKLSNTTRSSSSSFHTSPPPLKKCKRLGCTTCGRSPGTEAFVFPSDGYGERRGIPVGKTGSKRADAPAIDMPIGNESIVDNLEELKDAEARCMPSECVSRHVREETWQHKISDKVTQWLEDSCQSSVTSISLPADFSVCSESESRGMVALSVGGQEDVVSYTLQSCSQLKSERVADASSNKNSADQQQPGNTFVRPSEVKVSCRRWTMTTVCGVRYSIRCLKLVVCLPVVLLGLYLKLGPNCLEHYEPPPT